MKRLLPISLCVAAAIGIAVACKPDATPAAKDAEEWIVKFYTRYTIRGGWGFFGAKAKDKNVEVEINVPDQQAKELMEMNQAESRAFIARNACPPTEQRVWAILDTGGDVIIHTRRNGNAFAEISCLRDNVKGQ